ncbi:TraM recognition domain-containing protein [Cysteiniphilum litorale]|uniref:TraM recognition domain-containing protein n=1 Tax=Cysteiniphilum litorale TaxID=2056700 RepID=UPI003F8838A2
MSEASLSSKTAELHPVLSRVSAVLLYVIDVVDYLIRPLIWIADVINAFFHKINMIEVTKNIDNRFTPLFFFDLIAGLFLWVCVLLISCDFMLLPFDPFSHTIFVMIIAFWGFLFIRKGAKAWIYQHRLSFIAPEIMTNSQLPTMASKKTAKGYDLFMGTGFKWTAEHRQRLHTFVQQRAKSKWVKKVIAEHMHREFMEARFSDLQMLCNNFDKLMSRLGFPLVPYMAGVPAYHAINSMKEQYIFATLADRASHGFTLGTTGSGKTVSMTSHIVSDIKRDRLTMYGDPKGALDVLINMFCAAYDCGRLEDMIVILLGQHDISAKANLFGNYSDVSQVAGRMTSGMSQKAGDPFTASAWQAINQTAKALDEIGVRPDPASLHFYITRPLELLRRYCESIYPERYPEFKEKVSERTEAILAENELNEKAKPITEIQARNAAIVEFVRNKMDELTDETSGIEIDHIDMVNRIDFELFIVSQKDLQHRDKMINNVFPLFSKINGTKQMTLFSYHTRDRILKAGNGYKQLKEYDAKEILDNPKRNAIVYIGISSLSNKVLSSTIIRSFLADLTNYAGVMNDQGRKVGKNGEGAFIYIDETAEVANDEFIQLLNKARGTGFRISWATQTLKDLAAAYDGSELKAAQVIANSQGWKLIFRIKEYNDAKVICDSFDTIIAQSATQDSGVNDMNGHGFRSSNKDTINSEKVSLLTPELLMSLPNGHAIFINAANQAYKVRFPILKPDNPDFAQDILPKDFIKDGITHPDTKIIRDIMKRVNFIDIDKDEAETILATPIGGHIKRSIESEGESADFDTSHNIQDNDKQDKTQRQTESKTHSNQVSIEQINESVGDDKQDDHTDMRINPAQLEKWLRFSLREINGKPYRLFYSSSPKEGIYITIDFWEYFCKREKIDDDVDLVIEKAMQADVIDHTVYACQSNSNSSEQFEKVCFYYTSAFKTSAIYQPLSATIRSIRTIKPSNTINQINKDTKGKKAKKDQRSKEEGSHG